MAINIFLSFGFHQEVEFVGFSGKDIELLILDNSYMRIGCFSAIQTKDYDILAKKDESINQNADKIVREIPFHPRYIHIHIHSFKWFYIL